jgi:HEAT repeat protein
MPMPQHTEQQKSETTALSTAFDALKSYDQGSSRGALLPIDEAVVASLDDKAARSELERQLVTALRNGGSVVAREYICSKLSLIGTAFCVPALAALLNKPEVATTARNALEAIPDRQATRTLRDNLSKVEGLQKVGVINSLRARRDADSVRALTASLKQADTRIAAAATAALGDIATSQAAKALRDFQPKAPEALRQKVADAMLTCAERLLAAGKRADALTLYQLLATTAQPNHVQYATARGLELVSGKE